MMLEDYIQMLQRKLDNYGNVEVVITEEGNYSRACDGLSDLFDEAEIQTVGERKALVLGHSDQWC